MKKLRPRERKALIKVSEAEAQSRFRVFYDQCWPARTELVY